MCLCCLLRGCGFLLLAEALPAEHGSPLGRPERQNSLLATARANCNRFLLRKALPSALTLTRGALLFAVLAAFRQVLELLVVEENLLPCGKDEVFPAIHALEHSVLEFHGFPFQPQSITSFLRSSLPLARSASALADVSGIIRTILPRIR